MLRVGAALLIGFAVWLVVVSAPARAGDFEAYQERAVAARYTGRQVVASILDGETEAGLFTVERQAGATMTAMDGGSMVTGDGKARVAAAGVEIMVWNDPTVGSRYTTSDPIAVTRLGRPCDLFEIHEGEGLRARIVFDVVTAAPISYEVFDGTGKLFRLSAMLEVTSNMPPSMAMIDPAGTEFDVLEAADPGGLPEAAGGYVRADVYAGSDDTVHGFYTDGLFSFSVFELSPDADVGGLGESQKVRIGDADYRRRITPGAIWVLWNAGDQTYLVVGDLPPDHLERVLPDLPAPERRGFFSRVWHSLFG